MRAVRVRLPDGRLGWAEGVLVSANTGVGEYYGHTDSGERFLGLTSEQLTLLPDGALPCPTCGGNGTGVAERKDSRGHAMWLIPCPTCGGSGKAKEAGNADRT